MSKTVEYVVEWNDWDTRRGSRDAQKSFTFREEAERFFEAKSKSWKFNPTLKKVVRTKEVELLDMHTDK